MANNDHLVATNDDVIDQTNNDDQRGAPVVKRSLHFTIDQPSLIDNSPIRSRTRPRRLRKKLHSSRLKNSPTVFQSTGHQQSSKRVKTIVDNRLKRFRMLDPDEFQEMLNSLSHQTADDDVKDFNSMDTIGGMQLESKFLFYSSIFSKLFDFRLLVT